MLRDQWPDGLSGGAQDSMTNTISGGWADLKH